MKSKYNKIGLPLKEKNVGKNDNALNGIYKIIIRDFKKQRLNLELDNRIIKKIVRIE